MATCNWCNQEMTDPATIDCTGNRIIDFPDGSQLPAVPSTAEYSGSPCHDCNVLAGNYHHPGCHNERCPLCKGQLISCMCLADGDEVE